MLDRPPRALSNGTSLCACDDASAPARTLEHTQNKHKIEDRITATAAAATATTTTSRRRRRRVAEEEGETRRPYEQRNAAKLPMSRPVLQSGDIIHNGGVTRSSSSKFPPKLMLPDTSKISAQRKEEKYYPSLCIGIDLAAF